MGRTSRQEPSIDHQFGARPLNRAIQKYLEDPVAEEILRGEVEEGGEQRGVAGPEPAVQRPWVGAERCLEPAREVRLVAVAGVDVRGAAPGTRETDLLAPTNLVDRVHGILLAGGSAWGLDAATGVVQWLEEQGVGFPVGPARRGGGFGRGIVTDPREPCVR